MVTGVGAAVTENRRGTFKGPLLILMEQETENRQEKGRPVKLRAPTGLPHTHTHTHGVVFPSSFYLLQGPQPPQTALPVGVHDPIGDIPQTKHYNDVFSPTFSGPFARTCMTQHEALTGGGPLF